MALFIESSDSSGALKRTPLTPGRTKITAQPATVFRIVDDRGNQMDPGVAVKRIKQSLVIEGLPEEREVELVNFFRNCTPEYSCSFSLENFRNAQSSEITPASLPIGALQDGSFVMHLPATLVQAVPVEPEAEGGGGRGWIYVGVGALGLAAAAGGGSKGGGDGAPTGGAPDTPILTSPKVVGSATPVITGTGTPGSIITVTIDVGNNDTADISYVTSVGADGRWSVSVGRDTPSVNQLPDARLPDGTTKLLIRASNSAGASLGLLTETIVIDSIAPAAPVISPVTGDNAVSAAEAAAGVNVTGTAEANATINISWLGLTRSEVADAAGAWTSAYTAAQIAAATADRTVSVTASDAAGNLSPAVTQAVTLPAVVTPGRPVVNLVAADDRINRAEANAAGGVLVEGTAGANSRITLTWGSAAARQVTADASGAWSTRYLNADLPADGATTITASDSTGAGSRAVLIDRIPPTVSLSAVATDNVVTFPELAAGVTVTGAAPAGSTVVVSWGTASRSVTVSSTGSSFSALFDAASIPARSGPSQVNATATDLAGNSASTSVAVQIDTTATVGRGTSANDTLTISATGLDNLAAPGANVNGNAGIDTLSLGGSGLTLNLLNLPSTVLTSIERINLTGTGNNTLRLSVADVLDFASSNVFNNSSGWSGLGGSVAQRQLVVDGNAGDSINALGGWTLVPGTVSNGGQSYVVYTSGSGGSAAMLIIDTDITRSFV